MDSQRRAVIDVGTNSVKLLVGDVGGGRVAPVWETSEQTRLGEGFYASSCLQPSAIERTAVCVARLAQMARVKGAESVGVIATSAVREACNREEFVTALRDRAGLEARIISGEEEAEWMFRGVASQMAQTDHVLIIVDVGGGSTEITCGRGGEILHQQSLSLGTVRLLEQFPVEDPPLETTQRGCAMAAGQLLTCGLESSLSAVGARAALAPASLIGASGTATILARLERQVATYDREQLDGVSLSRARLGELRRQLWSLPLAERRLLPGMPPNRADVMLTGVLIYESVMDVLGSVTLNISLRGLRYGAINELW